MMSLEESNVKFILDQYEINERDRYKILSIVASLTNENTKLVKELNKRTLRNDLPESLKETHSKRDLNTRHRKRSKSRR